MRVYTRKFSISRGLKCSIIGSGNWGNTLAKIISENAQNGVLDKKVNMWVFDEQINGESLISIINQKNENVKYLSGISLPSNLIAQKDLKFCIKNADLIVFCLPHQFLPKICDEIKTLIKPNAYIITGIKGMFVNPSGIELPSQFLEKKLNRPVGAISGANIAIDVAKCEFAEATVGAKTIKEREIWKDVFQRPYFSIRSVPDILGVESCGAMKNIVALGAGFVDGLDLGSNTKSAIIRKGMTEIIEFSNHVFGECIDNSTFWESCGLADLIATCFSGRNRKCAEHFIRTGKNWDEIELELLNGQKLQGVLTAFEVYEIIKYFKLQKFFPFFTRIKEISRKEKAPYSIIDLFD